MNIKTIFKDAKKIVIKIGSSTITNDKGQIDKDFIENLSIQVKELMNMGKKVIIVSSGARIAGVSSIDKWSRKEDINYKQALCAIGQVELMDSYRKIFIKQDLHIAQILLTKEDFECKSRSLNIRNTLFTLIDEGVVPIINENDTVCVDEIKIGDNDVLSAKTLTLWGADLLILLSDINGIYDKNPNEYPDAKIIECINDINNLDIKIGEKSSFGTGGIKTKIEAGKIALQYDSSLIVAKGKNKDILLNLLNGTEKGTLFTKKEKN